MPFGDPDPSDPNILVGVALPADAEADREMVYAFAAEFASLGFSEAEVWRLFQSPRYRGAHGALRRLGEESVRGIVRECAAAYGAVRFVVRDAPARPTPSPRRPVRGEEG